MAETDPMNVNERRKSLPKLRLCDWAANSQKERSQLLDKAQALPPEKQTEFLARCQSINPCTLRAEIHALLERLANLPSLPAGEVEDVRLTLREKSKDKLPVTPHPRRFLRHKLNPMQKGDSLWKTYQQTRALFWKTRQFVFPRQSQMFYS